MQGKFFPYHWGATFPLTATLAGLGLDKALRCLGNANAEMAAAAFQPSLIDDADRNAYYAAFHAAKALVFQQTGKVQKSHGGVHSEFHNLVRADPTVDSAMLTFLTRAYDFKRIADYDIGPAGQIK